jgi:2-polyprenyl-3-methyl-5-hydroxy-6-metoxy-1,4-benzoquinol methylase
MSRQAGVAQETGANQWYRQNTRPEVMALLPPLKAGLKVLEIGCGEGRFTARIPGAAERWGIEPEERAAEIARTYLDRVFTMLFDDAKPALPHRYFDLVVCNDVIEHMVDHDAFLLEIRDFMSTDGLLVGSVPNVRFNQNLFNLIVLGDWHYQDSGVLDRTHFRFFTFRSMRRSLKQAGWTVMRLEGINTPRKSGFWLRTLAMRSFAALCLLAGTDTRYIQIGFVAKL